ncbi:MAG: hypothetical protein H8D56_06800 [Planctomycetes bacterium]|nr:hypothetical protein [Planctomycetota bacterium]
MINNIDYSEYSLDELLDVKRHIDPEEAPENYQNLMTELKKREKEIISRKSLISEKRKNKTEKRKKRLIFFIKLLSWMQMVGGFILFGLILWLVLKNLSDLKNLVLLPALLIPIYSIIAGYILLRAKRIGIYLSVVNQFLQLFHIQMNGFIYQYILPFGIYLYMGDMKLGIDVNVSASFKIHYGAKIGTTYFALNVFSIVSIILLNKYKLLTNRPGGLETPFSSPQCDSPSS